MRYWITAFAVFGLSACVTSQPQSRAEFRALVTQGAAFTATDTHVTNRRFPDVVEVLTRKAKECLNVRVTQTRSAGYQTSSFSITYRTTVRRVNNLHAELTVQHTASPHTFGPQMPAGGYYTVAIDIDRTGATKTKLSFYGPSSGWDDAFAAIKKWSNGQSAKCPFS